MRTILLTLIMGIGLAAFSQEGLQTVIFVFDNQSVIEEELAKETGEKVFNLSVEGILTLDHRKQLIKQVKKTRGVIDFVLTDDNKAKLTIYKFAKNWRYWSMFIKHSGVGTFKIEDNFYTTETIKELDN